MKAIINFSERTNRFKALGALITCLLFLIPPACEKYDPNQDSIPYVDEMVATPKAATTATKMYWGPRDVNGGWGENICTPWYDHFGNFVLKVQNISEPGANISTLEIRINDVLILTAKGLSSKYFVTKSLRSLSQCANISVFMEGIQGCRIRIWIEATFKGLGTVYGKHLYYKAQEIGSLDPNDFTPGCNRYDMAREYCQQNWGHLLIISDAKENAFVKSICNNQQCIMGLSDFDQEQAWKWVNWDLNRTVDWRRSVCGDYDPNCPIPWNWNGGGCMAIADYGYNNWGNQQPDNGGGGCDPWQQTNHADENVGVFNQDGTWDDRALEHINWMSFIIEWDYIPNSTVIRNLFMRQYPDYQQQYPDWQYPW